MAAETTPLVLRLGTTSTQFKEWRQRAESALSSPGATPSRAVTEDDWALLESARKAASEAEEAWILDRVRCEVLSPEDEDEEEDEEDLDAAVREVEASARRLRAAEEKRWRAERALRAKSEAVAARISECEALAVMDAHVDLQATERRLLAELEAVEAETAAILATTSEPPGVDVAKRCDELAQLVEDLGEARIVATRHVFDSIEVVVELKKEVRLAVILDESLRVETAHLAHDVVDVADVLDAARREHPPDDFRLLVAETRARIRQLHRRKALVASLRSSDVKVHANDDCDRLALVSRSWTATLTLPKQYPDHPPDAAPRLHALSVGALSAQVDALRDDLDRQLARGAPLLDVIDNLKRHFSL